MLVRLNDATPPSAPILTNPVFIAAANAVSLSWAPSADNIQVDHYQILRNGIPHRGDRLDRLHRRDTGRSTSQLSYVVRAIDTNGNTPNRRPATITTPGLDSRPRLRYLRSRAFGTTVTLRWTAATDNVGVVGYDVLRDGKVIASQTAAVRSFTDRDVPVGPHAWIVRARDDAKSARRLRPAVCSRSRSRRPAPS